LSEYISQRARWCLGTIQQIYTRWGFLGRGRVTLVNRISCWDAVMYWSVGFLARWFALAAPALYWWFGIATFNASTGELLVYLAPPLLASMAFMAVLSGNRVSPILTDVSQLLCSVAVLRSVAQALVKPFGHAFKVTAKGLSTDRVVVQWKVLTPFAVVATLTALGVLWNAGEWGNGRGGTGYVLNIGWSLLNIVTLCIAIVACVELPRPRREERFATDEAAVLRLEDGSALQCRVEDMAVTGARLRCDWAPERGTRAQLVLAAPPLVLPFEAIRSGQGSVSGRFIADAWARRELIARLYTGDYTNDVQQVHLGRTLWAAMRRMFS
jgi:cellulose synthase (UDP-forming)